MVRINSLLTKIFSTMNTRKLFFGFLAVAFLAMTAVSTTVITDDVLEDTVSIEKKEIKRL